MEKIKRRIEREARRVKKAVFTKENRKVKKFSLLFILPIIFSIIPSVSAATCQGLDAYCLLVESIFGNLVFTWLGLLIAFQLIAWFTGLNRFIVYYVSVTFSIAFLIGIGKIGITLLIFMAVLGFFIFGLVKKFGGGD